MARSFLNGITATTVTATSVTATTVTATTVTATTHAGASSIYNATNASGTLTIGNTAVTTGVSAVLNLGTAGPGYTGVNTVNIGTGSSGLGATNEVNIATTAPSNSGYNTVNIATGTPSTSTRQTVTIGNSTGTTVNIQGSSITLGSFTTTNITATNFIVSGTASAIGTSAAYSGSTLSLGAVSTTQEGAQIGMARSSDNTNAWYMDVYTPSTAAPTVTQLRFVDNNGGGNPVRLNMDTTGAVSVPGTLTAGTINASSDLQFGGTSITGAWGTSWSPTFTGISVSGTWVAARYIQIGKTVHFYARFNLTSVITGTSMGISLPPVNAAAANFQPINGIATITGTLYPIPGRITGTTGMAFYAQSIGTTYLRLNTISGSVPASWASGDNFTISGTYEAA